MSKPQKTDTHTSGAGLPPLLRDYICGACAGGANVLVGYPFDTVKVALQNSHPGRFSGPLQCFSHILSTKGVGGLFVGVSAPLIGGALECGVNYLTYTSSLHALARTSLVPARPQNDTPHDSGDGFELRSNGASQKPINVAPLSHTAAAGAVAGVTLSFVLAPVELVKCRLQVNSSHYRNPIHCVRLTIKEEGARGLLRGLGATLAREVPGNALFFVVYEASKRTFLPGQVSDSANESTSSVHEHRTLATGSVTTNHQLQGAAPSFTGFQVLQRFAATVAAGGIAGCAMWATVLPIDSAKTRIQAARPGDNYHRVSLLEAMKMAWLQGGLRSWWAGLGPTILRAFPANAAQWLVWEASLQLLS